MQNLNESNKDLDLNNNTTTNTNNSNTNDNNDFKDSLFLKWLLHSSQETYSPSDNEILKIRDDTCNDDDDDKNNDSESVILYNDNDEKDLKNNNDTNNLEQYKNDDDDDDDNESDDDDDNDDGDDDESKIISDEDKSNKTSHTKKSNDNKQKLVTDLSKVLSENSNANLNEISKIENLLNPSNLLILIDENSNNNNNNNNNLNLANGNLCFIESFDNLNESINSRSLSNRIDMTDTNTTLNNLNNCQTNPNDTKCFKRKVLNINVLINKKKRFILLSLIFSLIALIIIILLSYFIIKYSIDSDTLNNSNQLSNSSNSIQCSTNKACPPGYFSKITAASYECYCHKIQECMKNQTCLGMTCSDSSDDSTSSISCNCESGFIWSNRKEKCLDIDECIEIVCDISTSNGTCINTIGSYKCVCKSGYEWSSVYHSCVDINECETMTMSSFNSSNGTLCVNVAGSYYFQCKNGYVNYLNMNNLDRTKSPNDLACLDVNECTDDSMIYCNNYTYCSNVIGYYQCCLNTSIKLTDSISFDQSNGCFSCGFQFYRPKLTSDSTTTPNKISSRIIGGFESVKHSWPWMVSIGINYKYDSYLVYSNAVVTTWFNASHICGGTLITRQLVLTAAHCLNDITVLLDNNQELQIKPNKYHPTLASIFTIYVGVHDQTADKAIPGNVFGLESIRIHENFDSKNYLNDIALMRLNKPVAKSRYVDWICLCDHLNFVFPKLYSTLIAIGFGNVKSSVESPSNVLRQVDLKLLDFKSCDIVTYFKLNNPTTQFCAGYLDGIKDTCSGDSGSPLMYNYYGRWYVVGIVSYGQGCAQVNRPGIYTNVSYFNSWIRDNMKLMKKSLF